MLGLIIQPSACCSVCVVIRKVVAEVVCAVRRGWDVPGDRAGTRNASVSSKHSDGDGWIPKPDHLRPIPTGSVHFCSVSEFFKIYFFVVFFLRYGCATVLTWSTTIRWSCGKDWLWVVIFIVCFSACLCQSDWYWRCEIMSPQHRKLDFISV